MPGPAARLTGSKPSRFARLPSSDPTSSGHLPPQGGKDRVSHVSGAELCLIAAQEASVAERVGGFPSARRRKSTSPASFYGRKIRSANGDPKSIGPRCSMTLPSVTVLSLTVCSLVESTPEVSGSERRPPQPPGGCWPPAAAREGRAHALPHCLPRIRRPQGAPPIVRVQAGGVECRRPPRNRVRG